MKILEWGERGKIKQAADRQCQSGGERKEGSEAKDADLSKGGCVRGKRCHFSLSAQVTLQEK